MVLVGIPFVCDLWTWVLFQRMMRFTYVSEIYLNFIILECANIYSLSNIAGLY